MPLIPWATGRQQINVSWDGWSGGEDEVVKVTVREHRGVSYKVLHPPLEVEVHGGGEVGEHRVGGGCPELIGEEVLYGGACCGVIHLKSVSFFQCVLHIFHWIYHIHAWVTSNQLHIVQEMSLLYISAGSEGILHFKELKQNVIANRKETRLEEHDLTFDQRSRTGVQTLCHIKRENEGWNSTSWRRKTFYSAETLGDLYLKEPNPIYKGEDATISPSHPEHHLHGSTIFHHSSSSILGFYDCIHSSWWFGVQAILWIIIYLMFRLLLACFNLLFLCSGSHCHACVVHQGLRVVGSLVGAEIRGGFTYPMHEAVSFMHIFCWTK